MYKNHIYYQLGEILKIKKVNYFVFKGSYKLYKPYSANGDLDIFVLPNEADKLIFEAKKIGFIYLENISIFKENYTRDLFFYNSVSGHRFHLHLHTQINFGNKIASNLNLNIEYLLNDKKCLSEEFNLYILPPELDLILISARKKHQKGANWYKRENFQKELLTIQTEYGKQNNDLNYLSSYFTPELTLFIKNLLLNKVNNNNNNNNKFSIKFFKYRGPLNITLLMRFIHKFADKFFNIKFIGKRRIPFQGKFFVLVGIDGSGKSSAMNHLKSHFSNILDVEKVTLGSGRSGASFIRQLIFLIFGTKAFLKGHKGTRNVTNNKIKKKKISLFYSFWLLLCLFDKKKNIDKLQLALLRGKLVFVDRWIQDLDLNFADSTRLNYYTNEKGIVGFVARYEKKIFDRVKLFRPNLVIVLDITPQNSLIRKPGDLTIDQAIRNSVKMINFNWQSIAYKKVLNANLSQQQVLLNMTAVIWDKLKDN